MVLEPDTRRCASDDAGISRGGLQDPTSIGERNETFLIKMWKPLPSRRFLKPRD